MFEYKSVLVPEGITLENHEDKPLNQTSNETVLDVIDENKKSGWDLVLIENIRIRPYKRLVDSLLKRQIKLESRLSIVFKKEIYS